MGERPAMRECRPCGKVLPLYCFRWHHTSKDFRRRVCKECEREKRKTYLGRRLERMHELQAEERERDAREAGQ